VTAHDQCARCERPRALALNDPLERCRAAEAQPCLRQELQARTLPTDPTPNGLGLQKEEAQKETDFAHKHLESVQTEMAQVKKQLQSIAAELTGAREQVVQHQVNAEQAHSAHESAQTLVGRLKAELAQLKSEATSPVPPDKLDPQGPTPKYIQRVLAWFATSRTALASGGSALGIALGAGGVAGWHHTNPTPVPTPAPVSASALPGRIQDALPMELRGMQLHVDDVTKTVKVDKSLSPTDKERATLTINAVYIGAGLGPPTIDFPPDQAALDRDRPPAIRVLQARVNDALQRQSLDKVKAQVEEISGPGGTKVISVDVEANVAAHTLRADSIVRAVFTGAGLPEPVLQHRVKLPQPKPGPSPVPPPVPPNPDPVPQPDAVQGSMEELCLRELTTWQKLLNWKLTRCMQDKCCRQPMIQNKECVAFDARYPLNCPKPPKGS
jgi:hypothetical protein